MKYKILRCDTADDLIAVVNEHLNEGWELAGGVCLAIDRDRWENERKGYSESSVDHTWCQAILNRSEPSVT